MPRFAHGAATLVLAALTTTGCKGSDPLYCESNADCESGQICDVTGQFPASDGVDNTCIPDPNGPADGGAEPDAGGDAGMDGAPPDAMPECSDTRPCTDPMAPVCDTTAGVCRGCEAHTECDSGICGDDGACILAGNILYVSPDGDDANDCETPTAPCGTVQATIDKLADHTYILAAPGTYEENIQIQEVADLHIVGPGATISGNTNTDTPVFRVIDSVVSFDGLAISNGVGGDGTGIDCFDVDGAPAISVKDAFFDYNDGGGIHARSCYVTVTGSTFTTNSGGGLRIEDAPGFRLVNNIIAANGGPNADFGGVILDAVNNPDPSVFMHNTVVDNDARDGGTEAAGVTCSVTPDVDMPANLVFGNDGGQGEVFGGGCNFSYSSVNGGAGGSNISEDCALTPTFRLMGVSGCVDHVTVDTGVTTDIDGDVRPSGDARDIGADEYVE